MAANFKEIEVNVDYDWLMEQVIPQIEDIVEGFWKQDFVIANSQIDKDGTVAFFLKIVNNVLNPDISEESWFETKIFIDSNGRAGITKIVAFY